MENAGILRDCNTFFLLSGVYGEDSEQAGLFAKLVLRGSDLQTLDQKKEATKAKRPLQDQTVGFYKD